MPDQPVSIEAMAPGKLAAGLFSVAPVLDLIESAISVSRARRRSLLLATSNYPPIASSIESEIRVLTCSSVR